MFFLSDSLSNVMQSLHRSTDQFLPDPLFKHLLLILPDTHNDIVIFSSRPDQGFRILPQKSSPASNLLGDRNGINHDGKP